MKLKILYILILVVVFIFLGYFVSNKGLLQNKTEKSLNININTPNGWTEYVDRENNIAFAYPENYELALQPEEFLGFDATVRPKDIIDRKYIDESYGENIQISIFDPYYFKDVQPTDESIRVIKRSYMTESGMFATEYIQILKVDARSSTNIETYISETENPLDSKQLIRLLTAFTAYMPETDIEREKLSEDEYFYIIDENLDVYSRLVENIQILKD